MLLFDKGVTVGISLKTQAQAVRLAADDLQRDLRRLSGQMDGFAYSPEGEIEIRMAPGEPESYTVDVGERVVITGADVLGTIYGIYAFSNHCLGVLPTHRLVDVFPETVVRKILPAGRLTSTSMMRICYLSWYTAVESGISIIPSTGM